MSPSHDCIIYISQFSGEFQRFRLVCNENQGLHWKSRKLSSLLPSWSKKSEWTTDVLRRPMWKRNNTHRYLYAYIYLFFSVFSHFDNFFSNDSGSSSKSIFVSRFLSWFLYLFFGFTQLVAGLLAYDWSWVVYCYIRFTRLFVVCWHVILSAIDDTSGLNIWFWVLISTWLVDVGCRFLSPGHWATFLS